MAESRYKIVYSGSLMPGYSLESVKENLARLFKSDPGKVDQLFTGRPITLKHGLSEAEADKYIAALRDAGALVQKETDLAVSLALVDTDDHRASEQTDALEVAQMTCPKCGHEQIKAEKCSACGIVIDKYLAHQALQAEHAASLPVTSAKLSATSGQPSPYASPESEVGEKSSKTAKLHVFSMEGRIGRLRFMAWSMVLLLALTGVLFIIAGSYAIAEWLGYLVGIAAFIGFLVVSVQISVQRIHDIGWSGWLYLLMLIPYVGSVFALLIMIIPGSSSTNQFGSPPPENTLSVKILAALWLIPLIGFILALIFPAYQNFFFSALIQYP